MENTATFFETWDSYLIMGSYAFLGIAVLIVLFHEIKIMTTSSEKERYDYVNQHEIRYFWYAIIAFIAGISLYFSAVISPKVPVDNSLKVYVSIFFLAGFVVVTYLIMSNTLRILYPKFLENRLMGIRNKPRKSSAGNVMRKLSLEEGAVHLEGSQLAEHKSEIHSVEYDVWLDEKTGEKKVEKYMAYQHAEKCGECGFYTMKIHNEEVVKQPTAQDSGVLLEHYRCSYCKHREAKEVVIAALASNAKG
jgi:heme exporter protein D